MKNQKSPKPKSSSSKSGTSVAIGIAVLLGLSTVFFGWKHVSYSKSAEISIEEKNLELSDKDRLIAELEKQKLDLMRQLEDVPEMRSTIEAQIAEISELQQQLGTYQKISKSPSRLRKAYYNYQGLRKKYNALQAEIDNLRAQNATLVGENKVLKDTIRVLRKQNITLKDENEKLLKKMSGSKAIPTFNMKAYAVRGEEEYEKETIKSKKADRIKVCLTLGSNPMAEAEDKDLYVRVIDPDYNVINPDNLDLDVDGENLEISSQQRVSYYNTELDVCAYVPRSGNLHPGNYTVEVYMDNVQIGSTYFELR